MFQVEQTSSMQAIASPIDRISNSPIDRTSSDTSSDTTTKHLIIGAGFVGLGMAQALKAAGIPYDQVDASDDIGGNWHHGVYETAHLISSRKVTQFPNFPMPDHYPDFPSAKNIRDYLNAFVDRFELRQQIQINCLVSYLRPVDQNLWEATFANGETRIYKGVLLCNGHHWCKQVPQFKGTFNGDIIHAKDYKDPDQLRGKRVLVIGGGNSACDIAAEAARVGAKSVISMRESVWFLPKTFAGVPLSDVPITYLPELLQRLMFHIIAYLSFGSHQQYGLPKPNHRLFQKHPTLNNEVPYYMKHGRIVPRPAVKQLDGWDVEFVNGDRQAFDLIVCATGYKLVYPFLPTELQRVQGSAVNCYGGSFLDDYKGLYFIGWLQARGGTGSILGMYAPLFARFLKLQDEVKIPLGLAFKTLGEPMSNSKIADGSKLILQSRFVNSRLSQIAKRVRRIDAQYAEFHNLPLPLIQQTEPLTVF